MTDSHDDETSAYQIILWTYLPLCRPEDVSTAQTNMLAPSPLVSTITRGYNMHHIYLTVTAAEITVEVYIDSSLSADI